LFGVLAVIEALYHTSSFTTNNNNDDGNNSKEFQRKSRHHIRQSLDSIAENDDQKIYY